MTVTREELQETLRDLVGTLDRRFGRLERWLWMLSTTVVAQLLVTIYIATKVAA